MPVNGVHDVLQPREDLIPISLGKHLRMILAVRRNNGGLLDDQSDAAPGPGLVVSHMPVRGQPVFHESGDVGGCINPVGNGEIADGNGRKKMGQFAHDDLLVL